MSGRIALMVRGLPSIGIDEAIERFGKYYPEPQRALFHDSKSFLGKVDSNNSISFTNKETDSYEGGQGLNKQNISDLRQLQKDFKDYTNSNPGIYTNSPTSESRAKLYRRVGFQDIGNRNQVIDTRRIASEDLPYVQAIDASIFPNEIKKVLRPNVLESFVLNKGNVLAGSRLEGNALKYLMKGGDERLVIEDIFDTSLKSMSQNRIARKPLDLLQPHLERYDIDEYEYLSPSNPRWQEFINDINQTPLRHADENRLAFQNKRKRRYLLQAGEWMRRTGFFPYGTTLSSLNAADIARAYSKSLNYI